MPAETPRTTNGVSWPLVSVTLWSPLGPRLPRSPSEPSLRLQRMSLRPPSSRPPHPARSARLVGGLVRSGPGELGGGLGHGDTLDGGELFGAFALEQCQGSCLGQRHLLRIGTGVGRFPC